jgi:energy-converting hydrogenase B subunit D
METTLMTNIMTLFDVLLIVTLLGLAWWLLASDDIFKAVVLFISFGLLMALAWIRMNAPDIALAEAAIGAGLTGPLCLSALRRMKRIRKEERRLNPEEERTVDED